MANPYTDYVRRYRETLTYGSTLPVGGFLSPPAPAPAEDAPVVLLVMPHPDDECITGALPLRLLRECTCRVVNLAVTFGSREERKAERIQELRAACDFLGFAVDSCGEDGRDNVTPATREGNPELWDAHVSEIARAIRTYGPAMVVTSHDEDWHPTHVGTHMAVRDALMRLGDSISCLFVETEFWRTMHSPNLMIETGDADTADLIAAISCHVKEVERNPYHLRMPAWLEDNVRRGGELVCGQGGTPPDFLFATLYRLRLWNGADLVPCYDGGRAYGSNDSLEPLLSLREVS